MEGSGEGCLLHSSNMLCLSVSMRTRASAGDNFLALKTMSACILKWRKRLQVT